MSVFFSNHFVSQKIPKNKTKKPIEKFWPVKKVRKGGLNPNGIQILRNSNTLCDLLKILTDLQIFCSNFLNSLLILVDLMAFYF